MAGVLSRTWDCKKKRGGFFGRVLGGDIYWSSLFYFYFFYIHFGEGLGAVDFGFFFWWGGGFLDFFLLFFFARKCFLILFSQVLAGATFVGGNGLFFCCCLFYVLPPFLHPSPPSHALTLSRSHALFLPYHVRYNKGLLSPRYHIYGEDGGVFFCRPKSHLLPI